MAYLDPYQRPAPDRFVPRGRVKKPGIGARKNQLGVKDPQEAWLSGGR